MKLGKHAPLLDERTLKAARYLSTNLPPPPRYVDWTRKSGVWGMMLNDQIGDCTIAAVGHMIQVWSSCARVAPIIIRDADIVAAYSAITGYKPSDPSTDRGAVELMVLRYWCKVGVGGHRIEAYVSVNFRDVNEVKIVTDLFGGLYIGLALPMSAQTQKVWNFLPGAPGSEPNSWGGHAVPIVGYNDVGPLCITWGAVKQMTWSFFHAYCDEAYAVLSPDWFQANNVAPSGLDIATLRKDLKQLS